MAEFTEDKFRSRFDNRDYFTNKSSDTIKERTFCAGAVIKVATRHWPEEALVCGQNMLNVVKQVHPNIIFINIRKRPESSARRTEDFLKAEYICIYIQQILFQWLKYSATPSIK